MDVKIACFDFDGVFNSYKSGWTGDEDIPDPPVDLYAMKRELKKLMGSGYQITIYSTRANTERGRAAIRDWLTKYDLIMYVDVITGAKPAAVVYVDDRGITFTGNWNGLADKIINFKSWIDVEQVGNCSIVKNDELLVYDRKGKVLATFNGSDTEG